MLPVLRHVACVLQLEYLGNDWVFNTRLSTRYEHLGPSVVRLWLAGLSQCTES